MIFFDIVIAFSAFWFMLLGSVIDTITVNFIDKLVWKLVPNLLGVLLLIKTLSTLAIV